MTGRPITETQTRKRDRAFIMSLTTLPTNPIKVPAATLAAAIIAVT